MGLNSRLKLEWLRDQGALPLPRHQAYGTTVVKVRRVVEGVNGKSGETENTLRSRYEERSSSVLAMMKDGTLLLQDDDMPGRAE
jgi:hypothetical protein